MSSVGDDDDATRLVHEVSPLRRKHGAPRRNRKPSRQLARGRLARIYWV
jgi:hypothetical protein